MVYQVYRMIDGDTLESISKCCNCTSDDLIRLNGINEDEFISDSYIVIPKNNGLYSTYIVKKGDTLYDISNQYGVDLNVLYAINGLDDGDIIYPNQDLLVPNNVSMYLTKDGDTLFEVASSLNYDVDDFIMNNKNLILEADQVVVSNIKRD